MTTTFMAAKKEVALISTRLYSGDDESSVLNLWNKSLVRDPITTETFRRKVLLDENFDPDGCTVAAFDSKLVGFSLAIRRRYPYYGLDIERGKGWITAFFVHPNFREKGIGKKLLKSSEGFLAAHGVGEIFVSSYTPNYFAPGIDLDAYASAHTFFKSHGYKKGERVYSMGRSLLNFEFTSEAERMRASLEMQGIFVRPFEPKYITDLVEFLRSNYPGDLLRVALEQLKKNPGSDQIIIAVKDKRVIGFSHYEEEHFGPFAIHPDFRGRGIGTSLYYATALQMKENGQQNLWLAWASGHAKDFYYHCGLRVTRRYEIMKKELK